MRISRSVAQCGIVGVLLALCSCGNSTNELPTGDQLDVLLNASAGDGVYQSEILGCLQRRGGSTDEFLTYQSESERAQTGDGPPSSETQVEASLRRLANLGPDEQAPPDLSEPLREALFAEFEENGVVYAGCVDLAERRRQDSPVEIARVQLADTYAREVGIRLIADPRWTDLDAAWTACMSKLGFANLARGQQWSWMAEQIDLAASSRTELEALLVVESALIDAQEQCDDSARRAPLRQELEEDFLRTRRADIERLILLRAESDSVSPEP